MELTWCRAQLLLLATACVSSLEVLERVVHTPENNVICPQALSNCSVSDTEPIRVHDVDYGRAFACSLDVTPKLCCHGKHCTPCLWSNVSLSISPDPDDEEDSAIVESENEDEYSGELDSRCVPTPNNTPEGRRNSLSEDPYQVTICYRSAERQQERCKRLDFTMTSAGTHKILNLILVEYEDVDFGRSMEITVVSPRRQSRKVDIPALKIVCSSPHLKDIKQCKGPRMITERHDDVVKILVVNEDKEPSKPTFLCTKRGREGKCWLLANNSIPLESITDCMCFQAWNEDQNKARSEYCPFENNKTEFRANVLIKMSVSVAHIKTNDDEPVMSWNLTVPCRISAELWPCQLEADGQCREIKGFRQHHLKDWEENSTKLWASGKFVNITSRNHLQLCLKVKVDGKIVQYCQHRLERRYWSLVLLPLILVCLTIFGVLLVKKLKDMKGQVLLFHSSAIDPQLVCTLGQLLSEQGFGVFLDLWNQKELGSLGPAAWLHSKLDHIQKHGGKALLLLCPSALQRAECYWNIAVEKQSDPATYSSDTLASALACILADRQKGGAAQRFVLVQLECQELLIKEELPVLFRGLPLYKLPSQSQGLLMELCLESPNNVCGKLKKMWWIKRARRKLAKGVQNISNRMRARTDTMLTQSDSLSLDTEDTEERVFLKNEQH
ncbi:interleukin-17 receptor C [Pimephales promelas]|nr:interleukin-17 receptor C [Pimephales promelas]